MSGTGVCTSILADLCNERPADRSISLGRESSNHGEGAEPTDSSLRDLVRASKIPGAEAVGDSLAPTSTETLVLRLVAVGATETLGTTVCGPIPSLSSIELSSPNCAVMLQGPQVA